MLLLFLLASEGLIMLAMLAQQTQQFTSITHHFDKLLRSIFINIASPAPYLT